MVVCKPVNGWGSSGWFSGILTGTCKLMGMVDWIGMVRFSAIGRDVPAGSVTLAMELIVRPPVLMTTCALGMLTLLVNTTVVFCATGTLKFIGIWESTEMVVLMLASSILTKLAYSPPIALFPRSFRVFTVVFRALIWKTIPSRTPTRMTLTIREKVV